MIYIRRSEINYGVFLYIRDMIKMFIKKLMERRKRNIEFRKEFYKKTGVDLNEIDDNVGGGQ